MVAIMLGAAMFAGFQKLPSTNEVDEGPILVWDMNIYPYVSGGREFKAESLSQQVQFPGSLFRKDLYIRNSLFEIRYEVIDLMKGRGNGECIRSTTGTVEGNSIVYPGVFEWADLEFHVCANGLKELLVLEKPPRYLGGDLVLRGQLHYPPDYLQPYSHEDRGFTKSTDTSGVISLVDHNSYEVLRLASPVAFDSLPSDDAEVEEVRSVTVPTRDDDVQDFIVGRTVLRENEMGAAVSTVIPYEFLTAPTTVYPVYIDPTLTSPIEDHKWYNDTTIYLVSNLEVSSGGAMNLYNATLQVNCTTDREFGLTVHNGAEFNVYRSTIKPKELDKRYEFDSSGKVVLQDSLLNYSYNGLSISTGNVSLRNATIHNASLDGLHATGGNITVYSSSLLDCGRDGFNASNSKVNLLKSEVWENDGRGMVFQNTSGNVSECSVYSNSGDGIEVSSSEDMMLIQSEAHDNGRTGLTISSSGGLINEMEIHDNLHGVNITAGSDVALISNTIRDNSLNGLTVVDSTPELMENTIRDHDSGAGLRLDNSSPDSTSNALEFNDIGVEVVDGQVELSDVEVTHSSTYGVKVGSADLELVNSTVEFSGTDDMRLEDLSNITTLNTLFNKASASFTQNAGDLTVKWFLDIKVLSELDAPWIDGLVEIMDKKDNLVFSDLTNETGEIETQELTEFVFSNGLYDMHTPHTISVDIASAPNYISVSKSLVLYHRQGDIDGDLLLDVEENHANLTWYEAEGHMYGGSQLVSDGLAINELAVTPYNNTTSIINPATFNDLFEPGEYKVMVKAKSSSPGDLININVTDGATTSYSDDSYPIADDYHWYMTDWFELPQNGRIAINVSGIEPVDGEVRIDRMCIAPKNSLGQMTRASIEGQITDVCEGDSDYDVMIDGNERRNSTAWFEAEYCDYQEEQVDIHNNYSFSNGKAIVLGQTINFNLNIDSIIENGNPISGRLSVGSYILKIRCNISSIDASNVILTISSGGCININPNENSIDISSNRLEWYTLHGIYIDNSNTIGSISFSHSSQYSIFIDKIGLVQIVDKPDEEWNYPFDQNTIPQELTPAVDGDSIAVTAVNNTGPGGPHIVYLDNTGQTLWSNNSGVVQVTSPTVVDDGILYALIDGSGLCTMRLVDRDTGVDFWNVSYQTISPPGGQPTVLHGQAAMDDRVVFVETNLARCYYTSNGTHAWDYIPVNDYIITAPVVYGDYVILIERNPTIWGNPCQARMLDKDGSTLWTYVIGGSVLNMPAVVNGKLIVAKTGMMPDLLEAYPLDPDNAPSGTVWSYSVPMGYTIETEPIVGGDSVIVLIQFVGITTTHKVVRLHEQNGTLAWSNPINFQGDVLSRSPCYVDDRIYYLVYLEGEMQWETILRCVDVNHTVNVTDSPVVFDETVNADPNLELTVGTPVLGDLDSDGYLEVVFNLDNVTFCFSGGGVWYRGAAPWPMFHHDRAATGSANYELRYFNIDPDDLDMEHDGLRDGLEVLGLNGAERFEFEDMSDFWVTYMGGSYPADVLNNERNIGFFHQTGATLTSVLYGYDDRIDSEDLCDSWVEVQFNVSRTGQYEIDVQPLNAFEDRSRDFCVRGSGIGEGTFSKMGDGYAYQRSRKSDGIGDAVTGPLYSIDAEFLAHLIENATYFNLSCLTNMSQTDMGYIPLDLPMENFNARPTHLKNSVEHLDYTIVQGYFEARLVTNLSANTTYFLRVGVDIDRIPDTLWAEQTFEGTVMRIDVLDVDFALALRVGAHPFEGDVDGDTVLDGMEYEDGGFPWRRDADEDGISDPYELENGTDPGSRDSDFDGLRDRIELGATQLQQDPYTVWDSSPSTASLWERMMAYCNGNVTDLSSSTTATFANIDADPTNRTDPNNPDSDFDGLPDGCIDGWFYDPVANSQFQYTSQATNLYLYRVAFEKPYMLKYWGFTGTADNIPQVWEGEDYDLLGETNVTGVPWGFETDEDVGGRTGSMETFPNVSDSDQDAVPDGYEALYSQDAPVFVTVNGYPEYAMNPLDPQDGSFDNDPSLTELPVLNTPEHNTLIDMKADQYQAYAMNYRPGGPRLVEEVRVFIVPITTEARPDTYELEVFRCAQSSGLSNRENRIRWTTASTDGENGTYSFRGLSLSLEGSTDYWFVIRFRYLPFCLGINDTTTAYTTAYLQNGTWYDGEGYPVEMDLFTTSIEGDNLTNAQEYAAGTHPKRLNTDHVRRDNTGYDDLLNDGDECWWTLRTDADNGSFHYAGYLNATTIEYDGDSNGSVCDLYEYTRTVGQDVYDDPELPFEGGGREVTLIHTLPDGTHIVLNESSAQSSEHAIYVWKPGSEYESAKEHENGTRYYEGQCIKFTKSGGPYSPLSYLPEAQYRYRLLYLADPFDVDTDDDGILDGEESLWDEDCNQAGAEGEDHDTLNNARDPDSDNDGLLDAQELLYDQDMTVDRLYILDWDDLPNMADRDSDGDGILDGDELQGYNDTDIDGHPNILDIDSDNDTLVDGWVDEVKWKYNPGEGRYQFDNYTEEGTTDEYDLWEGEDKNTNGLYDKDANETDPLHNDTDRDGLIDGYGIGTVRWFGELTLHVRGHYTAQNITNQTDPDTDDDGLLDGLEILGWTLAIKKPSGVNASVWVDDFFVSNPTWPDTDNDGLNDTLEYLFSNPHANDTDEDGWLDTDEDANQNGRTDEGETNPRDADTDGDRLPDGFVLSDWGQGQFFWGEDRDQNGSYDGPSNDEPNPLDPDSDDDLVPDGAEFNISITKDFDSKGFWDLDGDGKVGLLDFDSDEDGLTDWEENCDANLSWYNDADDSPETDPLDPDTDDDGLFDGAEPGRQSDPDDDDKLNGHDPDSNDNQDDDGDDNSQTFVIFRTNAEYDHNTRTHDYDEEEVWVSVDTFVSIYQHGEAGESYNLSLVWGNAGHYYSQSTTEEPSGIQPVQIYLDYCNEDPEKKQPVNLYTPEGYLVYNTSTTIVIEVPGASSTTYHVFTKTGEEPDDYTSSKHNVQAFVYDNSESYDYRVCLSEDTDMDGLNNSVDRNSTDADIDDDGVPDGKEILWNEDTDGDTAMNCEDPDSDNDGLTDGTEMGYTKPVPTCSIYKGTNTSATFNDSSRKNWTADEDPSTTTNPILSDTDGDGLLDGWNDSFANDGVYDAANETKGESTLSGWDDPDSYNGKLENDEADPNDGDTDDDGLSDSEEVSLSTNPLCNDTDSDDLLDGLELGRINGVNGTDMDLFEPDGDPNTTTNASNADTDGDGIDDGIEDHNHNGIVDWNETDPCNNDTDADGLMDGVEDHNDNRVVDMEDGEYTETDPLCADTDADGLLDGEEDANGDRNLDACETDPKVFDTDGDHLSDGIEVGGWQVSVYFEATGEKKQGYPKNVTSKPRTADTDDDGLLDGYEYENATDPRSSDTDADGMTDLEELNADEPSDPCGFEGSPPNLSELEVHSVKIKKEVLGFEVTVGHKMLITVRVKDNVGVSWVEMKVKGQGSERVHLPSGTKNTTVGAKFETDWKKTIFSGYDLNITACDKNDNMGYLEKHIPSALEMFIAMILAALVALAEFLVTLLSAAIEWIWGFITNCAEKAIKPTLDGGKRYLDETSGSLSDTVDSYNQNGSISEDDKSGLVDKLLSPYFLLLLGIPLALIIIFSIIKYFCAWLAWLFTAVMAAISLIIMAILVKQNGNGLYPNLDLEEVNSSDTSSYYSWLGGNLEGNFSEHRSSSTLILEGIFSVSAIVLETYFEMVPAPSQFQFGIGFALAFAAMVLSFCWEELDRSPAEAFIFGSFLLAFFFYSMFKMIKAMITSSTNEIVMGLGIVFTTMIYPLVIPLQLFNLYSCYDKTKEKKDNP